MEMVHSLQGVIVFFQWGILVFLAVSFIYVLAMSFFSKKDTESPKEYKDTETKQLLDSQITFYLHRIADETDEEKIQELLNILRKICSKDLQIETNRKKLKILRAVDKWLSLFNVKLHILDLKQHASSYQVEFDPRTNDFHLRVFRKK